VTRLLIIEDDEDDYFITTDLLREADGTYDVDWERDARGGLAALTAGGYEACLLDFRLGATTGLELLAEARSSGVDMPIILLTGQRERETDLQAMLAGASDYLVKGTLDAAALERAIRYAVDRAQHTRALAESESRSRSLMESAGDGILIIDHDGLVVSWNPSASNLFGQPDLQQQTVSRLVRDPSRRTRRATFDLRSTPVGELLELEGIHTNGDVFPAEVAFSTWGDGDRQMWSAIIRDVTERKSLEARLEHQAFHDSLTGLANRTLLRTRLEKALANSALVPTFTAVLFLDIDDFKKVNDTLGHEPGDELLQQVAFRLTQHVRSGDTAARLGGDEFAIVLEDCQNCDRVTEVAERIRRTLHEPFQIGESTVDVSVSIGIDVAEPGRGNADSMLRHADVALYAAKARGKNQHALFVTEMQERVVRRINLEREIRKAAYNHEIVVHYQPIVDLMTGQTTSVEALMRWNHPQRGLQQPAVFVGIAEETGIIVDLGRQLHAQAFRQAKQWQDRSDATGTLRMSINASPRELENDRYVESIFASLAESGLSPESLVIEVTEGVMLHDRTVAVSRLMDLRDGGVRIALDDFGTGFCSLSYLHELPAEIVKIDRSFVQRLNVGNDRGLVPSIIAMSHDLGMSAVAEGIEDEETYELLRLMGCDYGQGYHMAKPADAVTITAFLDRSAQAIPSFSA
jgi:diguanylate cyclase (GGDEF)-like protein/PAS domain S-box-containing protein